MCDPITAGVASFASGALGAVGQYQSAQSANAQAIANYKHQLQMREHDWRMQLSTWAHRRLEYKNEIRSNNDAASRGYAAEQTRLNEQFMAAAFQKQDMLAGLLKEQGLIGEKTGVSAGRLNQSLLAQYGRNNATVAANLASARNAMVERGEDIRRQLQSANQKAYSEVALRPVAGIAPPTPQLSNPGMGLAIGLGQAAIGGFQQYSSLKAPPAFTGGGSPGGFNSSLSIPGVNYGGMPSYSFPSTTGVNWSTSHNFLV